MLLIEGFAMELKKYNLYIIELLERENLKLSDYIDVDRLKSIIEEQDIIYELNRAITNSFFVNSGLIKNESRDVSSLLDE